MTTTSTAGKPLKIILPTPCAKSCLFKTSFNDCGKDSWFFADDRHTDKDCEHGQRKQAELSPVGSMK